MSLVATSFFVECAKVFGDRANRGSAGMRQSMASLWATEFRLESLGRCLVHPAYGIGGVLLLSVILISALHFSGYEYFDPDDHEQVERRNRTRIAALEPGADTVAVTGQLGAPDFTDMFSVDGQTWRVLRYRTHRTHADGETTRDETTAVVFLDGGLIGVGDEALTRLPPATQAAIAQRAD